MGHCLLLRAAMNQRGLKIKDYNFWTVAPHYETFASLCNKPSQPQRLEDNCNFQNWPVMLRSR